MALCVGNNPLAKWDNNVEVENVEVDKIHEVAYIKSMLVEIGKGGFFGKDANFLVTIQYFLYGLLQPDPIDRPDAQKALGDPYFYPLWRHQEGVRLLQRIRRFGSSGSDIRKIGIEIASGIETALKLADSQLKQKANSSDDELMPVKAQQLTMAQQSTHSSTLISAEENKQSVISKPASKHGALSEIDEEHFQQSVQKRLSLDVGTGTGNYNSTKPPGLLTTMSSGALKKPLSNMRLSTDKKDAILDAPNSEQKSSCSSEARLHAARNSHGTPSHDSFKGPGMTKAQ